MTASEIVYDPASEAFADRALDVYRALRDREPLHWSPYRKSWVVSRYDDVRALAADHETFSSERTSISLGLLPQIQQMDPPRHDELRNLLWRAFTPNRVAALEPRVRELARGLVDGFARDGRCDLLHEFASQLPSLVIGELIGIPPERRRAFLGWTEALITANPGKSWDTNPFQEIYQEFAKLLELRRSERRDDLMSALIDIEVEGEQLSQEELLGFCLLLGSAGHETTARLICNSAVTLFRHPDQRAELVADPTLLRNAVEEMLRFDPPSQVQGRWTTKPWTRHGVTIPEDVRVLLLTGAAHRDPSQFPDPDRFDIHRQLDRTVHFGQGHHLCLGKSLARQECRVAFEEILARFPDYEVDEANLVWAHNNNVRGYAKVPMRL